MMNLAIQQRRFPSRVLKVQSGVFVDVSLTNGVNSCEIYRKPLEVLEDFILSETMPAWIEKDGRKLKKAVKTPKF